MRTPAVALLVALAACGAPAPSQGVSWGAPTADPLGPAAPGDLYRYAPGLVDLPDGRRLAFSCANVTSDEIKDHVVVRAGTRGADGLVHWGPETVALAPSDPVAESCTGFDCYHVCDPDVVTGRFTFGGTTYGAALVYTGNDVDASAHNAVGLALAPTLDGPWTRLPYALVPYDAACDTPAPYEWGVGQPSVLSEDGAGRVTLVARVTCHGASHALAWRLDLSSLDAPPALGTPVVLPTTGLTEGGAAAGRPDATLNDADFAYDAAHARVYVIRSQHPMPTDPPTNVTSQVQLAWADARILGGAAVAWTPLGDVAPADDGQGTLVTSRPRNASAALVRDPLGVLPDAASLEVAVSTSDAGAFPAWLWTKRIETYRAALR